MTRARVPMTKVNRGFRHRHRVLGLLQADGLPLLLPFDIGEVSDDSVEVRADSALLPAGERRAGVLCHDFRAKLIGLATATHTGWLRVSGDGAWWTPHTRRGFSAPANKALLLLANGAAARWGYRQAIKQGRDEIMRLAEAGDARDLQT